MKVPRAPTVAMTWKAGQFLVFEETRRLLTQTPARIPSVKVNASPSLDISGSTGEGKVDFVGGLGTTGFFLKLGLYGESGSGSGSSLPLYVDTPHGTHNSGTPRGDCHSTILAEHKASGVKSRSDIRSFVKYDITRRHSHTQS